MRHAAMVGFAVLSTTSLFALFAQAQRVGDNSAAVVAFAQKAAVRAVDCRQGDLASLTDAEQDFTPEGWKDFMKHMEGFLDAKGAPTFSATFTASRNAVLVDQKNGVAHVKIPGTLKQTHDQSSTTYGRAALEVYVSEAGMKIERLEQITCVGASTQCE